MLSHASAEVWGSDGAVCDDGGRRGVRPFAEQSVGGVVEWPCLQLAVVLRADSAASQAGRQPVNCE